MNYESLRKERIEKRKNGKQERKWLPLSVGARLGDRAYLLVSLELYLYKKNDLVYTSLPSIYRFSTQVPATIS